MYLCSKFTERLDRSMVRCADIHSDRLLTIVASASGETKIVASYLDTFSISPNNDIETRGDGRNNIYVCINMSTGFWSKRRRRESKVLPTSEH